MENKVILYVVKNNDTLESISKEFNIPISEIIRLNPLSKHHIFEGQPLILNIEEPQEIKVNKTYIENNTYQSFFSNLKLSILSKVFFKKGFNIYHEKLYNDIANLHTLNNILKENICKLFEKIIDFNNYLSLDKNNELVRLQKEINELSYIIKVNLKDVQKLSIDKIIENLELYILTLNNEDFISAENYFDNFEKEFIKLNK